MTQAVIPEWTVADRIRKAREVAGLEQRDLAALLYIARSTVSTWENSPSTVPHRLKLERIAEVCGVDVSWLLTGHEGDDFMASFTREYQTQFDLFAVA